VFTPFLEDADNDDKYTVVNYRMNWPGSGDPYYTAEGGTRKSYYGVSGVPNCFIDASSASTSSLNSFTSKFNTAYQKAPKAAIASNYQIVGTSTSDATVTVAVTITPTEDISGAKLHIAVVEKLTTGNVGTNGETEFHYVMMKMVPDASGTSLTLTTETPVSVTGEASLSGTNIEEMDDLDVVVWVQKTSSKEIINSLFSTEGNTAVDEKKIPSLKKNVSVRHNALHGTVTVSHAENALITMYDVSGKEVIRYSNSNGIGSTDISHLSQGCYIVNVKGKRYVSSHRIHIVTE